MKNAMLEEIAGTWEVMAETEDGSNPSRRKTLRECADTLRLLVSTDTFPDRESALEDLLRSACAIAERRGTGTAWDRFVASVRAIGLNGITARTYRVLPSDESVEGQAVDVARDAARLEWLQEQNATLDSGTWMVSFRDFVDGDDVENHWVGSDLRAAIDAAKSRTNTTGGSKE